MRWMMGVVLALAGCSGGEPAVPANAVVAEPRPAATAAPAAPAAPAPVPTPAATTSSAKVEADYLGRWTGVEGMYLVVTRRAGGGVSLEMQYDLDNKGTFDGSVTAEGLHFVRKGVAEVLRPTDGDATGLKYLAGKTDCLTVKPGEGYCRD